MKPTTQLGYLVGLEAHVCKLDVKIVASRIHHPNGDQVGQDHVRVGPKDGPQLDVAVFRRSDDREQAILLWLHPDRVCGAYGVTATPPDDNGVASREWENARTFIRQMLLYLSMELSGGPGEIMVG